MRTQLTPLPPILFLLFFPLLPACTNSSTLLLEEDILILEVYQCLDEHLSPKHVKCGNEVKDFQEMGTYDCSFRLGNFEFDIEKKFSLQENGSLKEYWVYKSEGPLVYTQEDLQKDPTFLEHIGGRGLKVAFHAKGQKILLNGDSLSVEKLFKKEKMILIKQKGQIKERGRRLLIKYH